MEICEILCRLAYTDDHTGGMDFVDSVISDIDSVDLRSVVWLFYTLEGNGRVSIDDLDCLSISAPITDATRVLLHGSYTRHEMYVDSVVYSGNSLAISALLKLTETVLARDLHMRAVNPSSPFLLSDRVGQEAGAKKLQEALRHATV